MAFIPRSQLDIATEMLAFAASDPDVASGILPTDLNLGSIERAHVESLALLLEESDLRVAQAIAQAISESCFRAFGFNFLPPQSAVGGVIFTAFVAPESDILIPIGSQLLGPSGLVFQTSALSVIPAGSLSSAEAPIICGTPGSVGNVAQDSITRLVSPIAGIDAVTNPTRTVGGVDTETPDARAVRFAAFLRTLVRGTKEALEFAALSASTQVRDARTVEPFLLSPRPEGVPFSGLVWLFVDDGTDSPDLDLGVRDEVSKLVEGFVDGTGLPVPGFKAAGTKVDIRKVPRVKVAVRGTVSLRPGGFARWGEIQEHLTSAASSYFDRLRVGEKASYQNLVTYLTTCDQDIAEVDLEFWNSYFGAPPYGGQIYGNDIVFYDPLNPVTVGARGILFVGTGSGPMGVPQTYPEWRLAQ